MSIAEKVESANQRHGLNLQVAEDNIGGHSVSYSCNPNPVARSFTPADLEAGEFERWIDEIVGVTQPADVGADPEPEAEVAAEPTPEAEPEKRRAMDASARVSR